MQMEFDAAVWQDVFDLLESVLPAEWAQIVLYLTYTDESGSIDYRIGTDDGQFRQYHAFSEISRDKAEAVFTEIDFLLMPVLRHMSEPWVSAAVRLRCDGRFQVCYDYTAIAERDAAYEQAALAAFLRE